MRRIVFAGGGTGGHIYPAIAVADEIKARHEDIEPVFIGTKDGLEKSIIPQTGYRIEYIVAKGLRGRGIGRQMITLFSIGVGVIKAMSILMKLKPILVFGSGGFVSAASLIAASFLGFPIVIQEQNSIPGLTNRLMGARAKRIYLGFEMARKYFRNHPRVVLTGNPLRRVMLEESSVDARQHFGLEKEMPVILVFGGSRGAHSLNAAAIELFKENSSVQGIVQTGGDDYELVRDALADCATRVVVKPYLDMISLAYRASDIAIARAGALSVSELAYVGLPSILVPYPFAADNHQQHNARALEEVGGAIVVPNRELSGRRLNEIVGDLLSHPGKLEQMRQGLKRVAVGDATERIVDDMEEVLGLKMRGKG